MTFTERLRELRGRRSRREVCTEAGFNETTFTFWETGKREPHIANILALCKFYGVSADYLLGLSDSPSGNSAPITASNSNVMSPNASVNTADERYFCRECPQVDRLTRIIDRLTSPQGQGDS